MSLKFYCAEAYTIINGSEAERDSIVQNLKALGFQIRRRRHSDQIECRNIRSASANHITVHKDNGSRITFGKSMPERVLQAMTEHKRTGYVRYKELGIHYHHTIERGKISPRTPVFETWYWNEAWFPLSPQLGGWVMIVQC